MRTSIIFLILFLFFQAACAQYKLTGKVTDLSGNPLAQVSVVVADQNQATVTDTAGYFTLSSGVAHPVIQYSYVGFISRKKRFKEDSMLVVLIPAATELFEVVVKAFERNTSGRDVAASVSVLDSAGLAKNNNTSLVPLLNTLPGVKMDERSPGSYRISIRGNLLRSTFGVRNVKVYWNGIPFTDANGNTYLNQVALNNVSGIEVIKGPSGSMYGAGTGGVLLLSSGIGKSEPVIEAALNSGSYGLVNGSVSYQGRSESSASKISFSHLQSDGYRAQTNMRRDVLHYDATYSISKKQDLHTNIFYSDLYYQTPGALTLAEMEADPRQARPAAGIFNSASAQRAALFIKTIYAGLSTDYRFNGHWSNTTGIYLSHTKFKNPAIRNYERKTEQGLGLRSVLTYSNKRLSAVFGSEYQYSFTNTGTYGNRLGITDTLQYQDEIDSRQFNVFVQANLTFSKLLQLNAGLSYNNFYYGYLRTSDALSIKQASNFTPQLIPRVSLLAKLNPAISLYVSAGKGYSPPSIDEVHASDGKFNRELRAEAGINYEAGMKFMKGRLWGEAAYYIFKLQNTIVSRRDASGADYYVNAGNTNQKGLELNINYLLHKNDKTFLRELKCWSSYTNLKADFSEYQQGSNVYDGNRLTGTPPNVLAVGADMKLGAVLFSNVSYNFTDRIPLNDANTFFAPAYNLLFVKAGYRLEGMRRIATDFFISWERSFNNPYSLGNDLNAAGNRFYNPSAPETFTTGIRVRFKVHAPAK